MNPTFHQITDCMFSSCHDVANIEDGSIQLEHKMNVNDIKFLEKNYYCCQMKISKIYSNRIGIEIYLD